ncbi:MAG: non-reducing end alpha-L-arabinofuranosidase family hydrolase [Bacteroidota bacterium]
MRGYIYYKRTQKSKSSLSFLHVVVGIFLAIGTITSCENSDRTTNAPAYQEADFAFKWELKNPILDAAMFDEEDWIAIKDPSIVRYEGKWHLFCTLRGKERSHAMVYSSFDDFEEAAQTTPIVLPNHDGYFCAPQVFYFTPQEKWYMICQAKDDDWSPKYQAAFATSEDIADPNAWSALQPMNVARPPEDRFLDFWVICDEEKAYNFFTCDNGNMYRCETTIADFPFGWSTPELAYQGDIFEASHIYKLPGENGYLNLIEAQKEDDRRYFKAYLAEQLDGAWQPVPSDSIGTYAAVENVVQVDGSWTNSISHGELIRDGIDEKMEASLDNPFIFQGVLHRNRAGKKYGNIPWRLGLLNQMNDAEEQDSTTNRPLYTAAPYPVGTSIRLNMLRNDTVMNIAGYEFNSLTAGNAMKMRRVIREGFEYNFEEADEYLDYAESHDMRMFGHTLLWHSSMPDFVKELEGDSAALYNFTKQYIDTLVSRYKGRIDAWDVVNEPVLDGTGELRENAWYNTFGADYLEMVFRMAHEADPSAKLFLNDYNIERDSAKLEGFLKIVRDLKQKGVPIHGIGMQMHIRMDVPNERMAKHLKKCVETGLLIHFSEVDIIFNRHNDSKGGGKQKYNELTEEMKVQQSDKYRQLAQLYNENVPYDQRFGITLWGFADRYTWIRYFFEIMDWPLIFDDALLKKPAYYGFMEGLGSE